MHAVRRALVEAQADRLGLALNVIEIPSPCTNEVYELRMSEAIDSALADNVEHFVFGDLFLEDVRSYREEKLAGTGISPLFPLWGQPTDTLAQSIIDSGVQAVVTCVDPSRIPTSFAGRFFDRSLLADLPPDVDPCGERGEFHTFVFGGPGFSSPIDIEVGEIVERDGFVFCDVRPRFG
jgi:diphthamide synthase (EF-2-diphthine--ammonia ligase)